ncbi:e4cac994-6e59-4c02-ab2f-543c3cfe5191 [Sclerotinia trifoliorum]|uniref:E4cac994-6e59-4c02-ab2f-543c3cfe5191 n=1 Tax=Sclerotinia trifoliorum TaxID=28548 RepID=A0A8H2VZZ7_9HELO|nr:e4cac994-6e59-4c02-ab2f-543c3cfe5191 [Sclerotinia trifoliorum]
MRTSALLSLLAGVGYVAAAATTKPFGLPKTTLEKKDIHVSIQADGLDIQLDITNSTASVVKPKVFIISMFTPEADIWYENSFTKGSIGNLFAKNITVPGFSPLFPQAHCLEDGSVCQLTTGESEINAASTITALTLSSAFDLTSTYFLVGGIAGINPKHGTLGDVAFSKYTIQVALQYEFDAREKPENFTTGYFPQGSYAPDQYPGNIYGTEVFEVNEPLRDLAVAFAKKATLNDSETSIAYRTLYDTNSTEVNKYQAATHAPTIITCDTATSDVYYSGTLLGEAFENTTTLLTNGSGVYCMTAQEDNATLSALMRAALFKLVDFSRIIIMRTASDFDRPYPGASVEYNLLYSNQGGFEPAIQNIYLAGTEVIKGLLEEWNSTFESGVNATNYIGDIFGSLGGEPDFGPGSEFGGEEVDPDNSVIYVKRDGEKKVRSRREMKGKKGLMRRH